MRRTPSGVGPGRALRAVGSLAVPFVLLGCNDHPLQQLDRVVTSTNLTTVSLPAKTKVDFLFVVDNSGSMCEEQRNLTRNFTAFSDFLFEQLGDRADFRIAVTSTDLRTEGHKGAFLNRPAPPQPSFSCRDPVTGEPDVPDTADCQDLLVDGRLPFTIIKSGPPERGGNITDKADLERKFRCLATLGTGGDTFEKGLEAMRLALSCNGPNGEQFFDECCVKKAEECASIHYCGAPGDDEIVRKCCDGGEYDPFCEIPEGEEGPEFLRPDAMLVVIFVTDENDCSDPASNAGASRRAICKYGPERDRNQDGIPDGYVDREICGDRSPAECFQHECGNLSPQDCYQRRCVISRSQNSNCEWFRDELTPVEDYREFLLSLKRNPGEQLLVAAIAGPRVYTPSGFEITYNPPARPSNPACDPEHDDFDPDLSLDVCCPMGRCEGQIQPSCSSENGEAFTGRRYQELVELFLADGTGVGCPMGTEDDDEEGGQCVHICTDDFRRPLEEIRDVLQKIVNTYCLQKSPACIVPARRDADGNVVEPERPCSTPEERTNPAHYRIAVRMQCLRTIDQGGQCEVVLDPVRLGRDRFELLFDDGCPGGMKVELDEPPPAGGEVFLEYQVAVGAEAGSAAGDAAPGDAGAGLAPDADAGVGPDPDAGP